MFISQDPGPAKLLFYLIELHWTEDVDPLREKLVDVTQEVRVHRSTTTHTLCQQTDKLTTQKSNYDHHY